MWKENYPILTILCGKNYFKNFNLEKKIQKNINYIEEYLSDAEFTKLLIKNGYHFCLASSSTFSNSLHNCLSVKSIPIYLNCIPYKSIISNNINGYQINIKKKRKVKIN